MCRGSDTRTVRADVARRNESGHGDPERRGRKPGAPWTQTMKVVHLIRASQVPWDDDAPVIREDERYERINETGGDPLSPRDRALVDEFGGDTRHRIRRAGWDGLDWHYLTAPLAGGAASTLSGAVSFTGR